jgi:ABC-type transport system substrate-binding protein
MPSHPSRHSRKKQGGVLKTWDFDSPASMSILEESTIAAERPMMAVFNNLVLFDVCGADRNYTGYCNPEVDKLVDRQSAEPNTEQRKQLVWEIEKRLIEDVARQVIFIRGEQPADILRSRT